MFNSYLKQCIICLSIIANINALPNIVFIVADDLGWNDVGFHGSADIKTPNIDALAYSGIILNNYYVNPICTPSRSALMTGKYPIHTGMQHAVLYGAEARGLPLGEKLLPQYLKDLGYSTHIVGKWHLGFFKKKYTPTFRGFDSHLGFWTGHHDYFDHTAFEKNWYGFDMRRNLDVARDLHGQYSTDVFTAESVKILKNKKRGKPFFLYIAHTAVHSANEYNFLPCPDNAFKKFGHIPDLQRRKFAGMLSKLDDSVGEIVKTLSNKNLLKNTIIVFTTDNGGPAAGFNNNAASNYPLRGVKNTLWEGGLRGTAFLWSKFLKTAPRVSYQSMHIVDWLPTLLQAVNENNKTYEREFQELDGISIWDALSQNKTSPRTNIFHNFDNIGEYNGASVSAGDWKLLRGTNYKGQWDSWYGPSGRNFTYDYKAIEQSLVGKIMKNYKYDLSPKNIKRIRNAAEVKCGEFHQSPRPCLPMEKPCLFNLVDDPCEQNNLAYLFPEKVKELNLILNVYKNSALPPSNLPEDPRSNPKYWNYTWNNFGDYI